MPVYSFGAYSANDLGQGAQDIAPSGVPIVVTGPGDIMQVLDADTMFDDETDSGGGANESLDPDGEQVLASSFDSGTYAAGHVVESVYVWDVYNQTTGLTGKMHLVRIYEGSTVATRGAQLGEYQYVFTIPITTGDTITLSNPSPIGQVDYTTLAPLTVTPDFVVDGTSGDDIIDNGYANDPDGDRIDGNDAADGSSNDVVYGYAGNDQINAGEGDDTVYGGDGNDQISGDSSGSGNDILFGEAGDDVLQAGGGVNDLYGGDGNDTLNASASTEANVLFGGAGDDQLIGGSGDDRFYETTGNDVIYSGAGEDYIEAGSGDDYVRGDTGNDTIDGGVNGGILFPPNYIQISTENQVVNGTNGGPDFDVNTKSNADGISTISYGALNGYWIGNDYADETHIHTISSEVQGGQIRFNATNSSETLTININGVDVDLNKALMDGWVTFDGAGVYYIDGAGRIASTTDDPTALETIGTLTIIAPFSALEIKAEGAAAGTVYELLLDSNPLPTSGNDTLIGDDGDDLIYGHEGTDELYGGTGNDLLDGGIDADTLSGGDDVDTIYGGAGDSVQGGEGGTDNDTLILSYTEVQSITYGGGNNEAGTVTFTAASGGGTLTFSEIENIRYLGAVDGTVGDDTMAIGYNDMHGDIIDGADGVQDTILGHAGNDSITSGLGNDLVFGGTGNDVVYAGDGNDVTYGDENDDILFGGLGDDQLYGGLGNDTLNGNEGADSVSGGDGDDSMVGGTGNDTMLGGDGNDSISSDADADLIYAGAGNDVIYAGSGNDNVDAGTGDNLIFTDLGDDTILADLGNDTINAGDGNDSIVSGAGDDLVLGGAGVDQLYAGAGNDDIDAGIGDDLVYGGNDNDTIAGAGGNDSLHGESGNDVLTDAAVGDATDGNNVLFGGLGDDTLTTGGGDDLLYAGTGTNLLNAGAGDDWVMSEDGNDTLNGDAGNDTLSGMQGNDLLYGGDGEDYAYADWGNDTIYGGAGNDYLNDATGDDTLYGGDDADRFALTMAQSADWGSNTIEGGEGGVDADTIDLAALTTDTTVTFTTNEAGTLTSGLGDVSFSEIEQISLGDGNDLVDASATTTGVTIQTGQGNDTVYAGTGNDTIFDAFGDDQLFGGAGNDLLSAAFGNDTLTGGAGDDTFDLNGGVGEVKTLVLADGSGNDTVVWFHLATDNGDGTFTGIDQLDVSGLTDAQGNPVNVNDVTVTADVNGDAVLTFPNGESITLIGVTPAAVSDPAALVAMGIPAETLDFIVEGTTGDDYIDVSYTGDPEGDMIDAADNLASNNDDLVVAGAGNDTVFSTAGDDIVYGEDGNDVLQTGLGEDVIYGGNGNDQFFTQNGSDTVYGGDGDDTAFASFDGDLVYGGAGNDWLQGGGYAVGPGDSIYGETGNDTLLGGGGNDLLFGGADNDLFQVVGTMDNDTITGGETGTDFDRVDLSTQSLGVTVAFSGNETGGINGAGSQQIAFSEIEGFILTAQADVYEASTTTTGTNTFAGAGNDTLQGGSGNDTFFAGADDDSIMGGDGADSLSGEAGNDNIFAGAGNDIAYGGLGNDTLSLWTGNNIGQGGDGDDWISAEEGNDSLYGGAGIDTIFGGAGNDLIYGGTGNDTINAGEGVDSVYGGDDADNIVVQNPMGTNYIYGGEAGIDNDAIDLLNHTGGVWAVYTGNEAGQITDTGVGITNFAEIEGLVLTMDDDWVDASMTTTGVNLGGFGGNDSMTGGTGADSMTGGEGDDTFYVLDTFGNDTINGNEAGETVGDTLDAFQMTGDAVLDLSAGSNDEDGTLTTGSDVLTFSNIENIILGEGNDSVIGSAGNDQVTLGGGQDTVDGGAGNDSFDLTTDGVQDLIRFADGDGNDTLTGFESPADNGDGTFTGHDLLDVSGLTDAGGAPVNADDVTVSDDGFGNAVLTFPNGETITLIGVPVSQVSSPDQLAAMGIPYAPDLVVDGTGGDDTMGVGFVDIHGDQIDGTDGDNDVIMGLDGNDNITAVFGDDTIYGGNGNDTVWAQDGNDSVYGDAGDDSLDGGLGDDSLNGGIGNDTLYAGWGNDTIDGGAGDDYFFADNGNDSILGGAGNDTILTGPGDDSIYGGAGADSVWGHGDNDLIYGGDDNDTLAGNDGHDSLNGDAGDDSLLGDLGNDTLTGGMGADTMYGGDDRDTFVAGSGDVVDGEEGGDDFDTLDLTAYSHRGTNIIYDAVNPENGTVEFLDAGGNVVGTMTFSNIENIVACFTPGSMVLTDTGEIAVEDLAPGDRVLTRDSGFQPIRWVGRRDLSHAELIVEPRFNPVFIAKGALGSGLPERDMMVSPQHRMLITDTRAELLFGEHEVLVAAKHLVGMAGVEQRISKAVSYIHILFDQHEVVRADGTWSESFQPGDQTLAGMDANQRAEVVALFPSVSEGKVFESARLTLKANEAKVLIGA